MDEFVELYNNTDSDMVVSTSDGTRGWTVVASTGSELFFIPVGTIIPARGHYLGTNAGGYSLNDYGGASAGSGDTAWVGVDIPSEGGVAVFRTNDPPSYTPANPPHAAGHAAVDTPHRQGAGLPPRGAATKDL